MKHQERKSMETRMSQLPAFLVEPQDTCGATKAYHSPQVFLVGKANRLIAGYDGHKYDAYPEKYKLNT